MGFLFIITDSRWITGSCMRALEYFWLDQHMRQLDFATVCSSAVNTGYIDVISPGLVQADIKNVFFGDFFGEFERISCQLNLILYQQGLGRDSLAVCMADGSLGLYQYRNPSEWCIHGESEVDLLEPRADRTCKISSVMTTLITLTILIIQITQMTLCNNPNNPNNPNHVRQSELLTVH
jgi:hypothetical protein